MTFPTRPLPVSPLPVSRDTQLCMSLAARPGTFGSRFHNYLYAALGLDYVYKAFTTSDLPAAIGGVRALGIRGCAVSMPFKEACIPLLDDLDPSAAAIESVNTIVNTGGQLRGHNTDYLAVAQLLGEHAVSPQTPYILRGSGGMAKAVASAMRDAGFADGALVARNREAGLALARAVGARWQPQVGEVPRGALLVNVTPIGMAGGPSTGGTEAGELAFTAEQIGRAGTVFDVVALPAETPLILAARAAARPVITGAEVAALQALEQFVLYTGVRPEEAVVARAAEYARS